MLLNPGDHRWFERHGHLGNNRGFSTLIGTHMDFHRPAAWTDDFDRDQRVRAWFTASLETMSLPLFITRHLPRDILRLVKHAVKFRFILTPGSLRGQVCPFRTCTHAAGSKTEKESKGLQSPCRWVQGVRRRISWPFRNDSLQVDPGIEIGEGFAAQAGTACAIVPL